MKEDMIYVVYVDDTIIAGTNSQADKEKNWMIGIKNDNFQHNFQVRDEKEVEYFLCIRIKKVGKNNFNLSQLEFIEKVLKYLIC